MKPLDRYLGKLDKKRDKERKHTLKRKKYAPMACTGEEGWCDDCEFQDTPECWMYHIKQGKVIE